MAQEGSSQNHIKQNGTKALPRKEPKRQQEHAVNHQPVPPDGGWGWVIAFSSFMIGFLVDGISFTFGIFLPEFLTYFQSSRGVTSWVGSVLNGSYLTIGPVASGLVNRFGCRKVAILGAVMAAAAFFLSSFSPNIQCMIIFYGLLGGVGFGFMYLPSIVMVGFYFEKKRALATGIAVCGSGIGGFVFAPLSEYLLQEYSWKGAMWIISAIVLNGVVICSLFRPLETTKTVCTKVTCEEGDFKDIPNYKHTNGAVTLRLIDENGIEKPFGTSTDELNMVTSSPIYKCRSMELCSQNKKACIARLAMSQDICTAGFSKPHHERKHVLSPLARKDIFYSGSIQHLPEYKHASTRDEYVQQMTRESLDSEEGASESSTCTCDIVTKMFDFSLLKSPTFVVYGISCFLCMMGFFIPFTYIPDLALEFGMSSSESAWLISIIGILNTIARLVVGYISDKSWTDCLLINNCALLVGGLSTMFVPFYSLYFVLAIYSALFGICIAAFVSLRSIIMVELMGIEKLTNSFGLVVMCQGLSSFIGSPIAGALADATGDYKAAFYLAGATIAMAGVICFPLRRIAAWENKRTEKAQSELKQNGHELHPMLNDTEIIVETSNNHV